MKDKANGRVRIGCFGGFWGDSMAMAVGQFLKSREADSLDYLVSDYLAEVTMCILAKKKLKALKDAKKPDATDADKAKAASAGSIDDFAKQIWKPFGATLMAKGIKVVVNAGGLDALGLKRLVEEVSEKKFAEGQRRPIVAAVLGDDLAKQAKGFVAQAQFKPFPLDGGSHQDSIGRVATTPGVGEERPVSPEALLSCNAYVGAGGIAAALAAGADVVITGRCVDSAMVLGPLAHEHGWRFNQDFDRLAAGSLAGHIIECGAQCTGGNFTDWELGLALKGHRGRLWERMGFPIVEVAKDGSFVVTKPSGTAGVVNRESVAEQMVYEIGDPAAYLVADAQCDFRDVVVTDEGNDRVRVTGAKGRAPTGQYKCSATFRDGYMAAFAFGVAGLHAAAKADAIAKTLLRRARKTLDTMGGAPYHDVRVEFHGAGAVTSAKPDPNATEVICRIGVAHDDPRALALVAMNLPSASTGMAPGLFTITQGRTPPSAAVALRSALVPAAAVPVTIVVGSNAAAPAPDSPVAPAAPIAVPPPATAIPAAVAPSEETVTAPLYMLACCRSGDKADAANVGVVCRDPRYYAFLRNALSPAAVRAHLSASFPKEAANVDGDGQPGDICRFDLPALPGMNFVLANVLGGGGLASLLADKQGKTIGSALLLLRLPGVPKSWVAAYERGVGQRKAAIRAKL